MPVKYIQEVETQRSQQLFEASLDIVTKHFQGRKSCPLIAPH